LEKTLPRGTCFITALTAFNRLLRLFYADDTIVFSKTKQAIEELLGLIKDTSGNYGLRLNKGKCVNMNMNVVGQQKQGKQDHDLELKGVDAAMYLGNKLNNKASVKEEITFQMQQVTMTSKRLHFYGGATEASK
jgi:hypothetical protein